MLAAALYAQNQPAALSRLATGIQAYERQDYPSAIASLRGLDKQLPQLADYAAYYLAAAEVESKTRGDVTAVLAPVWSGPVRSPLVSKAALVAANGLIADGRPAEAARLLTRHYDSLQQPDGDLALAFAYESAADLPHAVTFYQQVYNRYPASEAAQNAATALSGLHDRMGAAYPEEPPQVAFERARRLMEIRAYLRARAEFEAVAPKLAGPAQDAARLGMGTADYLRGQLASACTYMRTLSVSDPEVEAERLYYAAECAGRANDESARLAAIQLLDQQHERSRWRFQALLSLANRYLLANRIDDYEPLYQAAAKSFPTEARASSAHWKYAWASYIRRRPDAADRLREHLHLFGGRANVAAALYFLGRLAEDAGDQGAAHAFYAKLVERFPNYYYGLLAGRKLAETKLSSATPSPQTVSFLDSISFSERHDDGRFGSSPETRVRMERAHLLRTAGLPDLADGELRFGARNGGQPALLAMELARDADSAYLGLRAMKSFVPDGLNIPLAAAPRDFWRFYFPLPYKDDLVKNARAQSLDPYLVAALIRQESEFNPRALSRAKAYGLTQVLPVTGRSLARKVGIRGFTSRMLYQPATNLRLGTLYLRMLLDGFDGSWEETLASYNAGKSRVLNWRTWSTWREPAEFVESIPFTETREYVQSVLRNAELYRRIYR